MNVRQLEIFRAIMRSGSLTAAAEALHVSQPAVSKILRHFESQLGYALFDRIGGRLVPTAEAQLLFADADRVFREFEVIRDLAVRIRERKVGLLRVGASSPPTFSILPGALLRFQNRNPDVKVVLRTLSAEELSEKILVGEVDLGLTLSALRVPMVREELLKAAPVMVVMRADHRLAGRESVTPADIAADRLISYPSHADVAAPLDQAFEQAGRVRQVKTEISASISVLPLVQAGLGVALVDGLTPWHAFPGIVARPFEPKVLMSLTLVTNGARPMARFVREFSRDVQAVIAAEGPAGR
ncbi:LysR family transcriptional regulator [Acetobacteraceae bacterium H6797]|nr:LysR family transcriptional regulator [Acetobacteraceae bacterium H6797]